MNAFDFIVTVAIGSVFGRALTAKDVALSEAIVAFGLLVTLQYVVTWIQLRWPFRRVVTNPPALLYFRGEFVDSVRCANSASRNRRSRAPFARSSSAPSTRSKPSSLESSGEFSVIGLRRRRAHVRRATGGPALGVNGSQLTYLACRMTVCQLRPVPEQHRRTRRLETGWRFHRGDVDGGADPSLDDGSRPMGGGSPTSRGRFGQSRRRTATSSPNTNSTRCSAGPESSALSKSCRRAERPPSVRPVRHRCRSGEWNQPVTSPFLSFTAFGTCVLPSLTGLIPSL